ncbi:hypothetical protein DFP72DRAFT_850181 [Ephemerocybe angulata]|uniref:Uncharacterized protein n=1 Tax=Ephemerocybe angulata TaxID=980116 RepID=A0A8H6HTD7_9AGAR|nr:hypothetical protein DFP72DRAFT_850181 [Tulosesus angulatus]
MSHYQSQSPPPLRRTAPTHPAYIPEPPSTPASRQGYQRFSSSPVPGGPVPAQPLPPPHLQHDMQQQGQGQPIHPGSISSGPMYAGQQQQQQGGDHVPAWSLLGRTTFVMTSPVALRRVSPKSGQCSSLEIAARNALSMSKVLTNSLPWRDGINLCLPVLAIVENILLTDLHAGIGVATGFLPL